MQKENCNHSYRYFEAYEIIDENRSRTWKVSLSSLANGKSAPGPTMKWLKGNDLLLQHSKKQLSKLTKFMFPRHYRIIFLGQPTEVLRMLLNKLFLLI